MYESYFGLREKPFSLTPSVRFWFVSEQHEESLRVLTYGLAERVGFMMLSGEVGSGKTTTVRAFLNSIQDTVATSIILNPLLSPEDFLRSVTRDFGLKPEHDTVSAHMEALNIFLLELNSRGRTALVVIEEAQNLSFETFEMARMFSNLETDTQKLINILFVGQPELEEKLRGRELRQLAQRIQIHARLKPLTLEQTGRYIMHRLVQSGDGVEARFDSAAIQQIFKKSRGLPRVINSICEYGLLTAFASHTKLIDKSVIKRALKEVPSHVYYS